MKEKKAWLSILVTAVFIAAFVLIILCVNKDKPGFSITENSGTEYETARVLAVTADNSQIDETTENVRKGSQDLQVEILTGRYDGEIATVRNYFSALYNVNVEVGDTVCVRIDTMDVGTYELSIYNYNRFPLVIGLVLLFAVLLCLVGGWKGAKAFIGLAYTFICICFILIPLVLKGWNAVLLTSLIVFVTTTVCFFLIGGFTKKTLAAEIGCMCGVIAAAVIGEVSARIGGVSTFQMEEAEALLLVKSDSLLKMRGLFTAGILIAAMGAVMDVAMSISSAICEVKEANSQFGFKELFKSGMNIGRDAMGTMANTLVLAYVGSALNMMVLIYSYGVTFRQLICTDFVAIELIHSISGSIGIICTVPCVSLIAAYLFSKKS